MPSAAMVALAVTRFMLRLDLGPEFDSNANRAEVYRNAPGPTAPPLARPIPAFLIRSTNEGGFAWAAGPNRLRAGLIVAAKAFFALDPDQQARVNAQSTAIVSATVDDTVRLGSRALLFLSASYYDAFQPRACPADDLFCHRDMRFGGPRLGATVLLGAWDLSVAAGGNFFRWKPDDAISFDSGYLSAGTGLHLKSGPPPGEEGDESDWDLGLVGQVEWRRYQSLNLVDLSGPGAGTLCGPAVDTSARGDLDAIGARSLSYVGPLLAEAAYSVEYNRSTSCGYSFLRQVLSFKLVFELPWELTATARVRLVFTEGTGRFVPVSVEDDNRDHILVDLERRLGRGFSLSARYQVHRGERPVQVGDALPILDYARHLVTVGVTYRLR